jgi:hypothetical protein
MLSIAPNSRICAAATAWPGCDGRPGQFTRSTAGCAARNAASLRAFAQCIAMRAPSERQPRRVSQALNGASTAPVTCSRCATFCAKASARANTSAPPNTSLCPPKYLVVECMTMSAPNASGRCSNGVANVLSTTASPPAAWASSDSAAMSLIFSSGLDGVSIHSIASGAAQAARTASRSAMSPVSTAMPRSGRNSPNNMRRPL